MEKNIFENNYAEFTGEISKEPVFSHKTNGENFYIVMAKSMRMSGYYDEIPIMVSERLVYIENLTVGARVNVVGQYRSYNKHENGYKLVLSLFAREIEVLDEKQGGLEKNDVFLKGTICKEPVFRTTPLGREIADCIIATHRPYGKSDYIPFICWGRGARYLSELEVGTKISISGRLQSREYIKKLSETESEKRIAYEVSAKTIEVEEE